MKNLLLYCNPCKEFQGENKGLAKIQIDNSISLGWHREDILLFTNFPYGWNGVEATVIPDLSYQRDLTNKIPAIVYLFKNGFIGNDTYWYHDFDAYQNEPFGNDFDNDLCLTGYGYKPQVNGGSFFFKKAAEPIFDLWNSEIEKIWRTRCDEKTMTDLIRAGRVPHKMLNITYNFGQRCPKLCYEQADKPLKVLHFHPHYQFYPKDDFNINVMRGNNKHKVPMMSERLSTIFKQYGI